MSRSSYQDSHGGGVIIFWNNNCTTKINLISIIFKYQGEKWQEWNGLCPTATLEIKVHCIVCWVICMSVIQHRPCSKHSTWQNAMFKFICSYARVLQENFKIPELTSSFIFKDVWMQSIKKQCMTVKVFFSPSNQFELFGKNTIQWY